MSPERGWSRVSLEAHNMLNKNKLKIRKTIEIPCFLGPFFDTILSRKMPIGSREAQAPGTVFFYQ
jgi:hypothetical protein